MGKKVNPIIFRISNIKNPAINWNVQWFAKKNHYFVFLKEDEMIRKLIKEKVSDISYDKVNINRSGKENMEIVLKVSKPGIIIGRGGERSEQLKKEIQKTVGKNYKVKLVIKEIPKPHLCAELLCDEAKRMIERRLPFRKVMKKILDLAKKSGAQGVKIAMAGRLNGVEIARREKLASGRMPFQNE